MKGKFVTSVLVVSLGLIISTFTSSSEAWAGCGFLDITCNPKKWDNPIKTIKGNLSTINFKICNERTDGGGVLYSLNGLLQEPLRKGYCTTYSQYPPVTVLTFDQWFMAGSQERNFQLNNNKEYYFTNISGGIGFYLR